MRIVPEFSVAQPKSLTLEKAGHKEEKNRAGVGFGELLKKSIQEVNELQINSEALDEQLAMGTLENVHEATIAAEKAALALELTAQVRNKVLEAYQEIMRTPL